MDKLIEVAKVKEGVEVKVNTDTVTAVAAIHCIAVQVSKTSGLSVESILRSAMLGTKKVKEVQE